MLGLGLSLATTGVVSSPAAAIVAAFITRVETDGGTVESKACAKSDVKFLLDNPEPLAAPVNSVAPVISGTAERGETLSSTTGTWTNGTITYSYQWKRGGVDIGSATSNTYTLVSADDNTNITCNVTATNDAGATSEISNSLGPVLAAPLNLTSPVASGTAQVGQTLSTTDGTWQGIATITFAYQWRRDAVNISGATSSTYTLLAADYTTDIDCVVTATNGLGSASEDSNDIANIAGTAPSISGVPTISSQTQVGGTITATAASVTGVPTPTTSWQWQRSADGSTGWANISGATSSTYTLVSADDTKYVRAVQTSTNAVGTDSANSAASAQISQGSAFDADYQAVLDRSTTLGYTAPSVAQQTLQNTLVEDLKTAGVWSKLDAFYLFATDGDSNYATLNFVAPSSFQATKTNSPTFTANEGFTGDGVSAYLDTNLNASTDTTNYTQDDASFGGYVWDFEQNPLGSTSALIALRRPDAANNSNKIQSGTPTTNPVPSTTTGLVGLSRPNSTTFYGLDASGSVDTSGVATSTSIPNDNFTILRRSSAYSSGKVGLFWAGAHFTSAEWSDYVDAVDTYIAAL